MQNNIEKLKTLAENIQAAKLGKRGKEIHSNSHTVIDEYHEWRTESEDLFEQYFDQSNALYENFINLPRDGNGFVLMDYFKQQYPIFKLLIKKIESGEVMKTKITKVKEEKAKEGKTIFISHAIKDKDIIEAFVDLILHGALSVQIDKIFCISTDGTKIKSGSDWRNSIKENLLNAKINFLFITPNYKESEVCLNEMGAAWVTSATVLPLIVDPINYKTVGIIQEPNQIEKLLDEKSLDRIKDIVQEKLEIPSTLIKSERWTAKKKEFLVRVKKHLANNSFEVPMDRNAFTSLLKEKDDLDKTVENLIEEKKDLESLIKDLKKTKDKTEVTAIIKSRKPSSEFQEFEELCSVVMDQLATNNSIINGIIYKTYSGKKLDIQWQGNESELDEALANDFITEGLEADWHTTKKMRNIKKALDKVSEYIEGDLNDDFFESFDQTYDSPMEMGNKSFWEEVFEASISLK